MNFLKRKKINENPELDECLDCTLTEGITAKFNYLQKERVLEAAELTGLTPSAFVRHYILIVTNKILNGIGEIP